MKHVKEINSQFEEIKKEEKTKLEAMETTEKILIGDKELKTFNFVDFNRNR